LTSPKLDERQVLMALLDHDPSVLADRLGLVITADKGYVSHELDTYPAERNVRLLRPSFHGGRTINGVTAPIAQRILALTTAICHNRATGQPITRSLIALTTAL
jgi:hypothetical protein